MPPVSRGSFGREGTRRGDERMTRFDSANLVTRCVAETVCVWGVLTVAVAGDQSDRSGGRYTPDVMRYGPGVSNHPVGVKPSEAVQVPAGWPVDAHGSITCLTCHEALPRLGTWRQCDPSRNRELYGRRAYQRRFNAASIHHAGLVDLQPVSAEVVALCQTE